MHSFKTYLLEVKTIFDYLLFPPEGEGLEIANKIAKMKTSSKYVYRGMSLREYKALQRDKIIRSRGVGNTRDITGSYVSESLQLAGRFAFRAWLDGLKGVLVTFDRAKLPKLHPADKGNYWVYHLSVDAVVAAYVLGS